MFCWEIPGIRVDVTLKYTTYLNTDNVPYHTANICQEWFEEPEQEFKMLSRSPNSPDPIDYVWDGSGLCQFKHLCVAVSAYTQMVVRHCLTAVCP